MTRLAIMDLISLVAGSAAGVLMRFGWEEMHEYVFQHIDGWLLLFGGVLVANYLAGSYRLQYTYSRFNLLVTWFFSLLFATFILSVTSYAWVKVLLGRGVLVLSLSVYSLLSLFLKLLVYRSLFRREAYNCRTLILGTDDTAREVRRELENPFVLPAHKVVAYARTDPIAAGQPPHPTLIDGVVVVDGVHGGIQDIARSMGVNLIVADFARCSPMTRYYADLKRLRFEGVEILTPLHVAEVYSGRGPLDMINEEWLMEASLESNLPMVRRAKRVFDLTVSIVAIAALSPVWGLVAIAVKLSDIRNPAFYFQKRVGQFGRLFYMVKFRTMVVGAEAATGPVWSSENDPRITALGRWLRRFRLDELPQFVNILRGDMSVVGPRPERPEIAAELARQIPFYEDRDLMVPGLTGWAQIQYPYGSTLHDAKRKLEYDLYYMKHLSLSLDLQIILRTLRIVVLGKERSI
jgi:exopolysaccharide biosynthesis polyprenyl glycosylphosphotransferase